MKEKRNILLVSTNTNTSPYPVYPIGVSYLKTYLDEHLPGVNTRLFDLNFGGLPELGEYLAREEFAYIGLSIRNIDDINLFTQRSFIEYYREVALYVRSHSNATLLLGGSGFSIFPDVLLEELQADYGIKGEGEEMLVELITRLEQGRPVDDIDGLVCRQNDGSITINPRRRHLLNPALQFEEEWLEHYWNHSGMLNVQTKRGCPHRCIYCSYPVIEGHKVRTLDSEKVVETLKSLYYEKKINYVFFTDSLFNIDKAYNRELAERIIESGVRINWGAYFAPHNMDYDELLLYKRAGLTHIEFGTESFSDAQLTNYAKGFTWKNVLETSRICDELGIFYAHFMILGGYGETDETLQETLDHSRELSNTVIFPYIGMRIYPDTALYEIALQEGIIRGREELLAPTYYVSDKVNLTGIEERAHATGAKWVFPNSESEEMMARFRAKKRKGPLWEFLKYEVTQ